MNAGRNLYAEFRALPGAADEVASLVARYQAAVRAEPGNVRFDAHQLREDLDGFFVYEEYIDEGAFEAHLASPHGIRFNAELASLIVGGKSSLTWLVAVAA